jgi:fermentation-respiration switch protein FrsA (DUF1100 family)
MKAWVRRTGVGLGAVAAGGYLAACLYMYVEQDKLVYPASTVEIEPLPAPEAAGLAGFESVTIDTPDGARLKAWWHAPETGRGVVLYLHGQRHNLAVDWRAARLRDLAEAGFGVLAFEYRGFNGSVGHPSEQGLITDAETAYDFIGAKAPGARIALFGESLGTAVAIALAGQRPVAGVVLDSPFASMTRLGLNDYPWIPVPVLLRDSWNSLARIGSVTAPLLIAHCDADKRVPLGDGKLVFDAANQPKEMIVLPGCAHVMTWVEPVKSAALNDFATWIGGN